MHIQYSYIPSGSFTTLSGCLNSELRGCMRCADCCGSTWCAPPGVISQLHLSHCGAKVIFQIMITLGPAGSANAQQLFMCMACTLHAAQAVTVTVVGKEARAEQHCVVARETCHWRRDSSLLCAPHKLTLGRLDLNLRQWLDPRKKCL
jgi:hypothetical protein